MRLILFAVFIVFMWGCGGTTQQEQAAEQEVSEKVAFMEKLRSLCGMELQGEIFADDYQPAYVGLPMSFTFNSCTEKEVRIVTLLPSQEQFTIILTLIDEDLLLKHDVRDADLSPREITMYGGFAHDGGTSVIQIFPVHNFGGDMWPGYEDYSWEICMPEGEGKFEYIEYAADKVRRHFTAIIPGV
ncbi:MAG: hypothetical protein ACK4VN_04315 [Bacteroidales bacterium]